MIEIRVPWEEQSDRWWNELACDVIEHFGLPGGKYSTEITENFLIFHFKNDHDALLCKILISDSI